MYSPAILKNMACMHGLHMRGGTYNDERNDEIFQFPPSGKRCASRRHDSSFNILLLEYDAFQVEINLLSFLCFNIGEPAENLISLHVLIQTK